MNSFVMPSLLAVAVTLAAAIPANAQNAQRISLTEAVARGNVTSETVAMAHAGVERARGDQRRARADFMPSLTGSIGYTRTLRSEYDGLTLPFLNDSSESDTASGLPFGQKNRYDFGITAAHTLFAGGRVVRGYRISTAALHTAQIELETTRAVVTLDITSAYYDAVLADRLLVIAEAALAQAENTLQQVRMARSAGQQPEFEVLRAQVARDNQRPIVIRRKADRELAYLRLKQLLDLPLDTELELTTPLNDAPVRIAAAGVSDAPLTMAAVDTAAGTRAAVRQAEDVVRTREDLSRMAVAQRLPTVVVISQYGRVGYPSAGLPRWNTLRSNWTVGVQLEVPLFAGGRLRADAQRAQAELDIARKSLRQAQELAVLDARSLLETLRAAEASWTASTGTVEQALQAYRIADVRYREGLSTQLELSDARLQLQQAEAERAVAARDLEIARTQWRLLPALPLRQQAELPR